MKIYDQSAVDPCLNKSDAAIHESTPQARRALGLTFHFLHIYSEVAARSFEHVLQRARSNDETGQISDESRFFVS